MGMIVADARPETHATGFEAVSQFKKLTC
jgi:hypothetical protein